MFLPDEFDDEPGDSDFDPVTESPDEFAFIAPCDMELLDWAEVEKRAAVYRARGYSELRSAIYGYFEFLGNMNRENVNGH